MQHRATRKQISVTFQFEIVEGITLDTREAAFLRKMAQFCVEHRMSGNHAAKLLNDLLARAGVPECDNAPVRGMFEERE